ncbi:MAG: hypothetical protein WCJ73_03525 [Actinomycetes bacterium]
MSAHVIVVKTAFLGDFTTKTRALRVVTALGYRYRRIVGDGPWARSLG